MKIHLKRIPATGLHLEGEEDCQIFDLETDGVKCAGPLHYNLDVGISGDSLWVKGDLKQPVVLQCVSCLEKFIYTIEVPAFALHTELFGPETVDLTPFMREDILLNLPAHPHCDREGNRTCAAPMDAIVATEKRTLATKPDWAPLDKLKLKEK